MIADAIEQRDADDKIVEIVEGFSQKLYDQLKSRYQRFREAAELHKLNKHAFHIEFEVVKKDEEEAEGAAKMKEKGGRQLSEIEKKREQKAMVGPLWKVPLIVVSGLWRRRRGGGRKRMTNGSLGSWRLRRSTEPAPGAKERSRAEISTQGPHSMGST